MSTDIYTMNLSESSDGMVPIDMGNRSNAFVPEAQSNTYAPEIKEEKNIHDYKDDMDSTPISDVLGGPQEGTSLEPPSHGGRPPRGSSGASERHDAPGSGCRPKDRGS